MRRTGFHAREARSGDVSRDHTYAHRTVLEMQVRHADILLYVKLSLCLEKYHNVKVLSFKRWGV